MDLSNKRFERLLVIRFIEKKLDGLYWKCKCDCGVEKIIRDSNLLSGAIKSCGCLKEELRNIERSKLINQKFGRLTVLRYDSVGPKFLCQCDCGKSIIVRGRCLKSGNTKSCGCLNDEKRHSKKTNYKRRVSSLTTSIKRVWKHQYGDGNLTFDQFYKLSQMSCYYCGDLPNNNFNSAYNSPFDIEKNNGNFLYNGLDRIDSLKNHSLDNVVPCCKFCNFAKRERSIKEFKDWLARIILHKKTYLT
jgi:hypothetical protein